MEIDSALYDDVVGHVAHAEPARGATAVYSGGHAERQERVVSRGTCHARCRAAGIEVSHGIAYGECRLRPSLIALLHDPVGTHRMLYELRAGWCVACRLRPSHSSMIRSVLVTLYVLRARCRVARRSGHRSSHSSMIRSVLVARCTCSERDGVCGCRRHPTLPCGVTERSCLRQGV